MIVNAIAPYEGELVWVGTPSSGQTRSNEEWKSVDFVLKYTDGRMQENHICLNAYGVDKVNRIINFPIGTTLRVTFQLSAREYKDKWYGKNEVLGITVVNDQKKEEPKPQPAPTASAPVNSQAPAPDPDGDLPF